MNDGDAEGKEAAKQIKQSVDMDAQFPESKSTSQSSSGSDNALRLIPGIPPRPCLGQLHASWR